MCPGRILVESTTEGVEVSRRSATGLLFLLTRCVEELLKSSTGVVGIKSGTFGLAGRNIAFFQGTPM